MLFLSHFVITLYAMLPYYVTVIYVRLCKGIPAFQNASQALSTQGQYFALTAWACAKAATKKCSQDQSGCVMHCEQRKRDNPVTCCKMSGLAIRIDEGKREREEQTAQNYQAFNPVFHLTARNCSPVAQPGRCHRSSFCPKPFQAPLLHLVHRQDGSRDEAPPEDEHCFHCAQL